MKKLKVILPAILTLAVSTSAAVTGTVAWFTATRLRTVSMAGITAVNPEAGLNITVTEGANTKVEGAPNTEYTITHGKQKVGDVYNDVYLRDASVDLSDNSVHRAVVDEETGELNATTPYATVSAEPFNDANGKTYAGNKVVYATRFTASFTSTQDVPTGSTYAYGLFVDLRRSTFTQDGKYYDDNTAAANDLKLLKALRVGFSTTGQNFVWAPFAEESAVKFDVPTGADAGKDTNYRATYITTGNTVGNYNEADFVVAGNTNSTGDEVPSDTAAPMANDDALAYKGYLGALTTTARVVTVTTWFEGTDPNCVNNNFSKALSAVESSLTFAMRSVANVAP